MNCAAVSDTRQSTLVPRLAGSFLFLDLFWTAIYPSSLLFSLPL
jgi:hypothetical protein